MPELKPVENLIHLLQSNATLKTALETSLRAAQQPGIDNLEAFYKYLRRILTHIPTEKELMPSVREFYYMISHSPDDVLKKDPAFNNWMNEFVSQRGDFMDTTASAETLQTFIDNPEYKVEDYIKGPSGWLTYNQFLGRQLKPGKRPIAERCNDKMIVSPADSEYKGVWPVTAGSMINVKGANYSIADLLGDSRYKNEFSGGIFTHSFLSITDYHRFHMPVGGIVREVKQTPGSTWVTEAKKPDGTLENVDDVGFQFTHTRGHIIIESVAGLIAVMPVGMGHISSVNLTVDEGTTLVKGDEFGYFAFGGSDMILLFQANKIEFLAEKKHYKYGEQIARTLQ